MAYEYDYRLLEGKVALIHGASSGVGRASALAHARAGAKVMCVARDVKKLEAVVEEIKAMGGKAACNNLAQTAALDLIKHNIRVNTICPGGIRTPMMNHFVATFPEVAAKALGGGRMAEPEEQANAAVLLNSPLASAVNGVNLRTDCGYLAGSWLV